MRLAQVNGAAVPGVRWSRIALQPVLTDFVRFAYYLLLVLIKSNNFLVPRHISQQQRPSSTSITGGRTTVRQYLGNQRKTAQKTQKPRKIPGPYWEITSLSLRLTPLSTPEEVIFRAVRRFSCSELSVPDPDRLTDQTTVRNSGQHMQFFYLFAGLPRDPADCPPVIHSHILFVVRHLYVFRAARCKSVTPFGARALAISGGPHTKCALLGSDVFLLLQVVILCNTEPTGGRDTSKIARLKTSGSLEERRGRQPRRYGVGPQTGPIF